jgi:hypothetical protein
MKSAAWVLAACLAAVLGTALPAGVLAQQTAPDAAAVVRDAAALDALKKMGAYLRTLKRFEIVADSSTDQVTEAGQSVAFLHRTRIEVSRPNRMRIEVTGADPRRLLVYDGKTFVVHGSAQNIYARAAAPPTIDELVAVLAERYGIETPLADLFGWGLDEGALEAITSAVPYGTVTIDKHRCRHYAFRQPDVDWQIWIREGARPLPCQFEIVNLGDDARPRHSVRLQWNLQPAFTAGIFEFKPPAGAKPVPIRDLSAEPPQ